MNIINIQAIKIAENRIRPNITFDSVRDLADDIAANGLYHSIVLRKQEDGYYLLAGERRLTAMKLLFSENIDFEYDGELFGRGNPDKLFHDRIPYTSINDLSETDALEIELHENLIRKDLDWRTIVSTRSRLHKLRQEEAWAKGESWTVADTAQELSKETDIHRGSAQRAISDAELIAPYLDDPDLKNATTAKEAKKIVLRKMEEDFKDALREKVKGEHEHLIQSRHTLLVGDLSQQDIPSNYFDLIITDPPYGIDADKRFGDAARFTHSYEDSTANALSVATAIFNHGFVWAKPEAHLFMFCDVDQFTALKDLAVAANWKVWRTPLIWHYANAGNIPWGAEFFKRNYNLILYANKGNKPMLKLTSDVFHVPYEQTHDTNHAARKPSALYAEIMKASTLPDSAVIDPCCGSGPIFPAAEKENMRATGIELNPDIAKVAQSELERASMVKTEKELPRMTPLQEAQVKLKSGPQGERGPS